MHGFIEDVLIKVSMVHIRFFCEDETLCDNPTGLFALPDYYAVTVTMCANDIQIKRSIAQFFANLKVLDYEGGPMVRVFEEHNVKFMIPVKK